MTASFVQLVQGGKVKQPTQRGFKLSEWEDKFRKSGDKTPSGTKLFEAGKWIYQWLDSVRQALSEFDLSHYEKDKTLRMFVGDLNLVVANIAVVTKFEPSGDGTIAAPQLVQFKLKNEVGASIDPDSVLGVSIDGARFPISEVSNHGGKTPSRKFSEETEILRCMKNSTLLGQYYDSIEILWIKILWHGWEVIDTGDAYRAIPIHDEWAANRAVSDYRYHMLLLEHFHRTVDVWQNNLVDQVKSDLSKRPSIIIEGAGKKKNYFFEVSGSVEKLPPTNLVAKIVAAESYYDGLLQEVLPLLRTVSLQRLLVAWDILGALAQAHFDRFPKANRITKVHSLVQYAPMIDKGDLVDIFNQSGFFTMDEIKGVIDFFAFNPSPRNEIWDAPLIRLEKSKYAIVIGPLLIGNLLRTIECFMKRGELNISGKGPAFEDSCRKGIKRAMTGNPLLSSSGVYSKSYLLKANGKEEEIDILIWVGRKFFIGEAKCLFFPSDRMEFYNHYETIQSAIAQVERKANFLNSNKEQVKRDLNIEYDFEDVKPFVLVNSAFGAGFTYKGIPICDPLILDFFLRENRAKYISEIVDNEQSKISMVESIFYNTKEEAAEKFYNYLTNPPHLEIYKKYLSKTFYPLPNLVEKEKPILIGNYEVKLPFPELKRG